jgi:hypothetical protein
VTELSAGADSSLKRLQELSDKLHDQTVELNKRLENSDARVLTAENGIVAHYERIESIDKTLDDMHRDFEDVTSAATTGKGLTTGLGNSVKTLEVMNKTRELESKMKEMLMKLEVNSEAFETQFRKNKELMERASLDSQNSLVLAQSNRERSEEQLKMIRLVQDELNEKVNADDFDVFRQQVNTGGHTGSGGSGAPMPIIPTKELNMIKDNAKRLDFLEQDVASQKARNQNTFRDFNDKLTII